MLHKVFFYCRIWLPPHNISYNNNNKNFHLVYLWYMFHGYEINLVLLCYGWNQFLFFKKLICINCAYDGCNWSFLKDQHYLCHCKNTVPIGNLIIQAEICKYISMAKASIISHVELSEWQDCSGTQLWIAGENGHHK